MMDEQQSAAVLSKLALDELPVEEQEAFLLELNDTITKGFLTRIIVKMDEKGQEELTLFMEQDPSEEELAAFLRARVPDADALVAETIQMVASDILASTGINQE